MHRNRIIYGGFTLAVCILLICSGNGFLLGVLILLMLFGVLMHILLKYDAHKIYGEIDMVPSCCQGNQETIKIRLNTKGHIYVAKSLYIKLEEQNDMLRTVKSREYQLMMSKNSQEYELPFFAEQCGRTQIVCTEAAVYDLLALHLKKVDLKRGVCVTVYPADVNVELEVTGKTLGGTAEEGMTKNTKGNDPSEIFEIRDYIPGDDMRSIHWKLSGKMDRLIVRQASNPAHYNLLLMPDFGLQDGTTRTSRQGINKAIALCNTIGSQLIDAGAIFGVAIPTRMGLEMFEIHSHQDFQNMMSLWLTFPNLENAGEGLGFFSMNHMEQYFNQLLIVTVGSYPEFINTYGERIGVMLLDVMEGIDYHHIQIGKECEVVQIPIEDGKETIKISC